MMKMNIQLFAEDGSEKLVVDQSVFQEAINGIVTSHDESQAKIVEMVNQFIQELNRDVWADGNAETYITTDLKSLIDKLQDFFVDQYNEVLRVLDEVLENLTSGMKVSKQVAKEQVSKKETPNYKADKAFADGTEGRKKWPGTAAYNTLEQFGMAVLKAFIFKMIEAAAKIGVYDEQKAVQKQVHTAVREIGDWLVNTNTSIKEQIDTIMDMTDTEYTNWANSITINTSGGASE